MGGSLQLLRFLLRPILPVQRMLDEETARLQQAIMHQPRLG